MDHCWFCPFGKEPGIVDYTDQISVHIATSKARYQWLFALGTEYDDVGQMSKALCTWRRYTDCRRELNVASIDCRRPDEQNLALHYPSRLAWIVTKGIYLALKYRQHNIQIAISHYPQLLAFQTRRPQQRLHERPLRVCGP